MQAEINQSNSSSDDENIEMTSEPKISKFEYKEGGYGWVVCVATAYTLGVIYGIINNYSLIYSKFDIVYNNTKNHVVYSG